MFTGFEILISEAESEAGKLVKAGESYNALSSRLACPVANVARGSVPGVAGGRRVFPGVAGRARVFPGVAGRVRCVPGSRGEER